MDKKKYEYTGKTKMHEGVRLKQIVRLSDGEVGGWIQSHKNLSHDGDCWVSGDAKVYGDARVYENAKVFGDSSVSGNARVHGDARVYDNARVLGDACVYGDARVLGDCSTSPFFMVLSRHEVTIADNTIVIGCQHHTFDKWIKKGEEIAKNNGYSDEDIFVYRRFIEHAIEAKLATLKREEKQ